MKSIIASRKGQLNTLAPAIIALTIAAFFLIMGLMILQSVRDTDVITQVYSNTTTNESVATVNELGDMLYCGSRPGANSFTIATCIEGNDSKSTIPSTNYSVSSIGVLTYVNPAAGSWNNTAWNCTYSCKYGDMVWSDSNSSVEGLGVFSNFWTIIVLVVVITLVLGIIVAAFGGISRQR